MILSVFRAMAVGVFVTALVCNQGEQAQVPGPVGEPGRGGGTNEIPDWNTAPSGGMPTGVIFAVISLLCALFVALLAVMRQKQTREQTEKQLDETRKQLEQTRQDLQKTREESGPGRTAI